MLPRKPYTLSLPDGRILRLGDRTLVMGIINVTPDSFADGGDRIDPAHALDAALAHGGPALIHLKTDLRDLAASGLKLDS